MSTSPDLWGRDIALDESGQARIAASGELILTDGVETGLQDIRLRLFTRLGTLFYDDEFGSLVHDWILEESTEATRAAFCSEVVMRVEADPRVTLGSVSCSVLLWDERPGCAGRSSAKTTLSIWCFRSINQHRRR